MGVEVNSCLSRSNAWLAFPIHWKGVPDLVRAVRGSAMEPKPRINLL